MPTNEKLNSQKVKQPDTVRIKNAPVEKPQSYQKISIKKPHNPTPGIVKIKTTNQVPPLKNSPSQKEKVPATTPPYGAP